MNHLPAVVYVDRFENHSIAKADRKNDVVYLAKNWIPHLSENQLFFAVLHEYAHIYLDSEDDIISDRWAALAYKKEVGSLREPIKLFVKLFGKEHPRTKALAALEGPLDSEKLDNLAASAIIAGGSSLLNSFTNLFASKQQGRDARALQASQERISYQQGSNAIDMARLQSQSAVDLAKKKIEANKTLFSGLLMLAVVVGVVLVLRDIF